jgi:hypothetical protein
MKTVIILKVKLPGMAQTGYEKRICIEIISLSLQGKKTDDY